MATLESQLQCSTLNDRCRTDLSHHVAAVKDSVKHAPELSVTTADAKLPDATQRATASVAQRFRDDATFTEADQRLERYKAQKEKIAEDHDYLLDGKETCGGTYYKKCSHAYIGQPSTRPDVFQISRRCNQLSGRDRDFVYRYAEAASGSAVPRPAPTDDAGKAAVDAYTEAYRRYTGRDPTQAELAEVDRLAFAFDGNGGVGVIQKPHSGRPHVHIASSKTYTTRCADQLRGPELPPVRAARSQFPGTIPTMSRTKHLPAVTTNGTYKASSHMHQSTSQAADMQAAALQ